jgi:hypothetical protein
MTYIRPFNPIGSVGKGIAEGIVLVYVDINEIQEYEI